MICLETQLMLKLVHIGAVLRGDDRVSEGDTAEQHRVETLVQTNLVVASIFISFGRRLGKVNSRTIQGSPVRARKINPKTIRADLLDCCRYRPMEEEGLVDCCLQRFVEKRSPPSRGRLYVAEALHVMQREITTPLRVLLPQSGVRVFENLNDGEVRDRTETAIPRRPIFPRAVHDVLNFYGDGCACGHETSPSFGLCLFDSCQQHLLVVGVVVQVVNFASAQQSDALDVVLEDGELQRGGPIKSLNGNGRPSHHQRLKHVCRASTCGLVHRSATKVVLCVQRRSRWSVAKQHLRAVLVAKGRHKVQHSSPLSVDHGQYIDATAYWAVEARGIPSQRREVQGRL
mmetsp:Transcript_4715/g.13171  ORF Transcript_4715/g.13171 Transcript_4715/m.13171 type:complete len:344 (-) Transcript_4715:442-1473(-)